ncbi:MAG: VanZ family protein [Flavobacteriales bacterium]
MIAACIAWAAIVFVLHVMKVELEQDKVRLFPHSDKVIHFSLFAILSWLILLTLFAKPFKNQRLRSAMAIVLVCALYGGILEWLQSTAWVMRDCDMWDWCADVAGSVAGIALFPMAGRRLLRISG